MDDPVEPVSPAEIASAMADAFEKTGAHPAHVFAVRQCGFVLTEWLNQRERSGSTPCERLAAGDTDAAWRALRRERHGRANT